MSDNYRTICAVKEVENPTKLGEEILHWLQSDEIIESKKSDCILSMKNKGYKPGKKHLDVVLYDENITKLKVCGLQTITEREVFNAMAFTAMTKIECPNCGENRFKGITPQDFFTDNCTKEQMELYNSVFPIFDKWTKNENAKLTCNHCGVESEIENYIMDNSLSLSNLGFTFWNWPDFKSEFIDEFRRKIGTDIKIINGHI